MVAVLLLRGDDTDTAESDDGNSKSNVFRFFVVDTGIAESYDENSSSNCIQLCCCCMLALK